MKRSRKPLPRPQFEFGFAPDAFNLIQDTMIDFARIRREREQAERDRAAAAARQSPMFPADP